MMMMPGVYAGWLHRWVGGTPKSAKRTATPLQATRGRQSREGEGYEYSQRSFVQCAGRVNRSFSSHCHNCLGAAGVACLRDVEISGSVSEAVN